MSTNAFGQLAAEYSSATTGPAPCGNCYLTYDHLGSVRVVTDQAGRVVGRHAYLPFGEEIAAGQAGRSSQFGAACASPARNTMENRARLSRVPLLTG